MSGRIERGKYYSQHEIDHRELLRRIRALETGGTGTPNSGDITVSGTSYDYTVPANTFITAVIIQSPTTQTIRIGTTAGNDDVVADIEVTANVDEVIELGAWFPSSSHLHLTNTDPLTLIYLF